MEEYKKLVEKEKQKRLKSIDRYLSTYKSEIEAASEVSVMTVLYNDEDDGLSVENLIRWSLSKSHIVNESRIQSIKAYIKSRRIEISNASFLTIAERTICEEDEKQNEKKCYREVVIKYDIPNISFARQLESKGKNNSDKWMYI